MAFAHYLRVHSGEQGHRRRRMPEVMEGDFRQARSALQLVEVASQLTAGWYGSPNSSTKTYSGTARLTTLLGLRSHGPKVMPE